jgi:hypothetical protein
VFQCAIVVETPGFDDLTRLSEASEQVLVEAFVAKASDKTLRKSILHRLARSDAMPLDPALLLHFRIAFEVSSVPLSLTMSAMAIASHLEDARRYS